MPARLLTILAVLTCGIWALILLLLNFPSSISGIVALVLFRLMTYDAAHCYEA